MEYKYIYFNAKYFDFIFENLDLVVNVVLICKKKKKTSYLPDQCYEIWRPLLPRRRE